MVKYDGVSLVLSILVDDFERAFITGNIVSFVRIVILFRDFKVYFYGGGVWECFRLYKV